MPSSATITSFYTFSADTKARASEVNANFNAFRGHFFPLDPNSVAGHDDLYDMGSIEYFWRTNYVRTLHLKGGATNTAYGEINMVAQTAGAMLFQISGVSIMQMNASGLDGAGLADGSVPIVKLGGGFLLRSQTFGSNGSWTCPALDVSHALIVGWGGGGGGAGGVVNGSGGGGGGGGAGTTRRLTWVPVNANTVYTVVVGTGGAGGAAAGNGSTGNDSSFGSGASSAGFHGGAPGLAGSTTNGGVGGENSTNLRAYAETKVPGGSGGNSSTSGTVGYGVENNSGGNGGGHSGTGGGGGGGGAGPSGNGGDGGTSNGGNGTAAGVGSGAGGGGGAGSTTAAGTGGAGGSGGIVVLWVSR